MATLTSNRCAALYDIHGNLPALEAVLQDLRREEVDLIVVGGDVVPGPMPRDSLTLLQGLDIPVHFIRGNGEREVLAMLTGEGSKTLPEQFREAVSWVARQLDREHHDLLASWPHTIRVDIHNKEVLFCHATPRDDNEIFTRLTSEDRLLPIFTNLGVDLVVCGHTHMQFERRIGDVSVVNAGSVGMPFGRTGADWLLIGSTVDLRHTLYDREAAAERIRRTEYPMANMLASDYVLNTPSEDQMLEVFSRGELK